MLLDKRKRRVLDLHGLILPPAWLGVIGGGQLGRLFTQTAQSMGYKVFVWDPDPLSPAGAIADYHQCSSYDHKTAFDLITSVCAAVTTEFENVPAQILDEMVSCGLFVSPRSQPVLIAQNRILEKKFFYQISFESGVRAAPYLVIEKESDLVQVPKNYFPGILKTARMGYDGKGQIPVKSMEELECAWSSLQKAPCVLEKKLNLAYELSIIIARGFDGCSVNYPPSENIHRDGILHTSTVPSPQATDEIVINWPLKLGLRMSHKKINSISITPWHHNQALSRLLIGILWSS